MEFLKTKLRVVWLPMLALGLLAGCSVAYRADKSSVELPPIWPFYHGDPASRGVWSEGGFTGKLDFVWEYRSNDKPAGPLTMYHGHVVYPGARNKIKFVQLQSGIETGYIKPKGHVQTGMIASRHLGFFAVGPKQNLVKCVDLTNGNRVWKRHLYDPTSGLILIDRRLIVGSSRGTLLALRPTVGDELWSFSAEENTFTAPAAYSDGRIYQPGDKGVLYAIDFDDGRELFRVTLGGPLVSPVAVGELVYVTDMSGHVYGLDRSDGQIVWREKLSGPIWTTPAVAGGKLVVGHSGGEVVALDAATGRLLWKYAAVDVVRASVIVVGDFVVAATLSGKLFSLSLADGQLIDERQVDGAISVSPVSDGERIYVATDKGQITCWGNPFPDEIATPQSEFRTPQDY